MALRSILGVALASATYAMALTWPMVFPGLRWSAYRGMLATYAVTLENRC